MTPDEKSMLKHGLFWAALIFGYWLFFTIIHGRFAIAGAVAGWFAFLFVVFYRYGARGTSH